MNNKMQHKKQQITSQINLSRHTSLKEQINDTLRITAEVVAKENLELVSHTMRDGRIPTTILLEMNFEPVRNDKKD
jgi:hypothetical protein